MEGGEDLGHHLGEFVHNIGVLCGNIFRLAHVCSKVVEFNLQISFRHILPNRFPITNSNGLLTATITREFAVEYSLSACFFPSRVGSREIPSTCRHLPSNALTASRSVGINLQIHTEVLGGARSLPRFDQRTNVGTRTPPS